MQLVLFLFPLTGKGQVIVKKAQTEYSSSKGVLNLTALLDCEKGRKMKGCGFSPKVM